MMEKILHSDFFRSFNIGHVTLIIVALIGFGRIMQRLDDLEKAQPKQIDMIDRQQNQIVELQRRADVTDSIFRQVVPKLETLNNNVLTLMARNEKR